MHNLIALGIGVVIGFFVGFAIAALCAAAAKDVDALRDVHDSELDALGGMR